MGEERLDLKRPKYVVRASHFLDQGLLPTNGLLTIELSTITMEMVKLGILNLAVLLFIACPLATFAKATIAEVRIESRAISSDLCKEMSRFNSYHVEKFFERATIISGAELHTFDQLDCHIRGSLKMGKYNFNFDIQPIGIGRLINKKTGKVQLFSCKVCNSLFPPSEE